MKRIVFLAAILFAAVHISAFAEDTINLEYNGTLLESEHPPVIINGRTLVPVRTVCEAMGLDVSWNSENQTIRICDELNLITLQIGNTEIDVNDAISELDSAPEIINGVTCVPIRAVVEPFGASVGWNSETRTVMIDDAASTPEPQASPMPGAAISAKKISFYSQPDPEWEFESNGRGYCWVCSYAMVISNLTGKRVTPVDVAAFNLDAGGSTGSYMASHFGLADEFGLKFVPALDENSEYFDSFETERRGATYIKAETDDDVRAALIEAIDRNPKGVMVRFEGYPHTIVATGYYDGVVYFNDPAGDTLENVDFARTCLAKSFTLTDLSFIQALELKE